MPYCSLPRFRHFSVMQLSITKVIPAKILSWILGYYPGSCDCSGYHTHTFWKNWVWILNAEFNAESIGTNFKSQIWKPKKLVSPFLITLFDFVTNIRFFLFSENFGQLGISFQVEIRKISWIRQKNSNYLRKRSYKVTWNLHFHSLLVFLHPFPLIHYCLRSFLVL